MAKIPIPGYFNNIKINNLDSSISNKKKERTIEDAGIKSFKDFLEAENKVKFSAHAQKRLDSRNINLDEKEIEKLQNGINKIKEKGGKESLILIDSRAYVVSVKNNTVVTVVDEKSLKENVFTNIDSVFIT